MRLPLTVNGPGLPGVLRRQWLWVVILTLLALPLRLGGLGDHWLNPDEGMYLDVVTEPDSAVRNRSLIYTGHPPLYYAALMAVDAGPWDLVRSRLPAALAGAAAVPLLFLFTAELAGVPAGAVAALALLLSPPAGELSKLIRPYMPFLAVVLLALLLLARWLRRRRWTDLAGYAAAVTVALYTNYAAVVVLAAAVLAVAASTVTRRLRPREAAAAALAHLLPAAAFVHLWLWQVRPAFTGRRAADVGALAYLKPGYLAFPEGIPAALLGAAGYLAGPGLAPAALAAALAGLALALGRGRFRLVTLCGGMLLAAVALSALGRYPLGCSRHSSYLAAALLPPMGLALASLRERRGLILGSLLLAIGLGGWWAVGRDLCGIRTGPRLNVLPERIIPMDDFQRVRAALEEATRKPGLLVMDRMSYYSLFPLFEAERRQGSPPGNKSAWNFRWGERTVLIGFTWMFEGGGEGFGDPAHLGTYLERVAEKRPELLAGRADVRVTYAGWGWPLLNQVRMVGNRRGKPPVAAATPGEGIGVFRLKARQYLRALKRAAAREAREEGRVAGP